MVRQKSCRELAEGLTMRGESYTACLRLSLSKGAVYVRELATDEG